MVSSYLQVQANHALQAKLDNDEYDDSSLVEMRVSLNLPYQNDWSEFERFNGEVEIDGVQYKYVKRKIEKGQLVVMCIPNHDRMKIENSRDDYFKRINDLDQKSDRKKSEKSNSFAYKGLLNEFQSENNNWSVEAPGSDALSHAGDPDNLIPAPHHVIPGQPPDATSQVV